MPLDVSRPAETAWSRRSFLIGATAVIGAGSLAACTGGSPSPALAAENAPTSSVLPSNDLEAVSVALSRALFSSSPGALVVPEDLAGALAPLGIEAHLPVLVGDGQAVIDELGRLGVKLLALPSGMTLSGLKENVERVEIDPSGNDTSDIPRQELTGAFPTINLVSDPDSPDSALDFARTIVEGAGGSVSDLVGGEPRANSESVHVAKTVSGDDPTTGVLALGTSFGDSESFRQALTTAVSVPEIPGGGQIVVPHRRMVAAYGSPHVPSLGILGEQDLPSTIERVKALAAEYEPYSEVPVIPAFEIIATVASADAGGDGDYSNEIDPDLIQEWVDAAGEAGVYVVLDLQPGRTDFLTQAKRYEKQLLAPHVGLALDPEWRLKPDQRHMVQIGGVDAEEVNATATWLADLTRDHNLPQKVFILHQFAFGMLRDREQIDTSRPELAMMLHADGHGTPDLKMGTWRALQENLPEGIHMAWKNFLDEDTPTFTPEKTYNVEPRPWFVSYQ